MMNYICKIYSMVSQIFIKQSLTEEQTKKILKNTEEILYRITAPLAVKLRFDILIDGTFYERVDSMDINSVEKFTLTVKPLNEKGGDAPIEGAPTWTSSDEAVAKVVPGSDGLTAEVLAVGVGTATITAEADSDLSEGVNLIHGTIDVNVTSAPATELRLDAGPVTVQDSETPETPEEPENPPA